MSAPSDTSWGGVVANNGSEGRIGISRTWTGYPTYERATVQVWFWSKYTVSDTSNRCDLAVAIDGYNQILVQGDKSSISHPTNSAWSTRNQTLLVEYEINLDKGYSNKTVNFNASFQGIEALGGKVMYANRNYTIDALASHTVSYHANGGTNAPSNQTKWYGSVLTLSSTNPTRSGYDFLGWGTSSTDTTVDYNAGGSYGTDANITLYAIWSPHKYEVLYDANGGENAPSGQTKLHDTPLPLQTAIPTRTYYNFLGWSTNKTATEPTYKSGDSYTTNASVTLYAVWELAYVKPRINNLKVYRCDIEGNMADDGEYAKITFDWATDKDGARYCAYYKRNDEDEYTSCVVVDISTTSGCVETFLIGANGKIEFNTDYSYDIKLNVADSFGYNYEERTLHATFLTFDMTEDGRNMSFGESAHDEEDEVLRLRFKTVDIAPKERLLYNGQPFEDYIKSIISTLL